MFEKNLEIGYLLDFYGEILPERRRDIMDLYYNDDLSLSEIAEQMGITRQAVRDSIKKTEQELFFYEERLGLRRRLTEAETRAETALALEEASYAAAQLKHSQGTISQNALLTAADELESARDAVNSAAIDLFSAYNNYRWAVDHGILN